MKFAETMAVGEVIQQIRERTGVGGPDYGLFQPVRRKKDLKPRWLKNDKSLVSYEIESEVNYYCLPVFTSFSNFWNTKNGIGYKK
jgi:hypothetical protein